VLPALFERPDGPVLIWRLARPLLAVSSGAHGGPRSLWGARLARAVHRAVLDGGKQWLAGGVAWSDRQAAEQRGSEASRCGIVAEANDG
jgi:hypothetical protein